MSAVLVMMKLLQVYPPLIALVPASRVFAGTVVQEEMLPAISVREISRNEFATVAQAEASSLIQARIQVTVHAKDYSNMKAILLAAKLGPGIHTGVIGGVKVRSVRRDDVGPDLSDDDAGIYRQSRDFMVRYIEPT